MTINDQTAYFTAVQKACAQAKKTGKESYLSKAAILLDDPMFNALPERAQDDLRHCYNDAAAFVLGIGGG